MNNSQRKILIVAFFVFSPILFLIGLEKESAFVAIILPIASIFAGLFFKKSNAIDTNNKQITYDEYASAILPLTAKGIAFSFVDSVLTELKKDGSIITFSEKEMGDFILSNFDIEAVRYEFTEIIRKNYTNEEFQYLAKNALSPLGLKIVEKSHLFHKDFEKLLMPEISRVVELAGEKFDLYG
jgi:hypothetical protein